MLEEPCKLGCRSGQYSADLAYSTGGRDQGQMPAAKQEKGAAHSQEQHDTARQGKRGAGRLGADADGQATRSCRMTTRSVAQNTGQGPSCRAAGAAELRNWAQMEADAAGADLLVAITEAEFKGDELRST